MKTLNTFRAELLADPATRTAYDALATEFETARELVAALPRRNQWVFSSPTAADGRLKEPRNGHERALSAAGLPHLSIHGLRRSFGTLCEWVEMPAGVVAQIQGAQTQRHG